jgi:ABC-type sugar transport system permease subunit
MGYAAAMSVVMFVVSVVLAAAVFRWARGWVFYGGEEA